MEELAELNFSWVNRVWRAVNPGNSHRCFLSALRTSVPPCQGQVAGPPPKPGDTFVLQAVTKADVCRQKASLYNNFFKWERSNL